MAKCLRCMRGDETHLLRAIRRLEHAGSSLTEALSKVLLDASLNRGMREAAARVLAISDAGRAPAILMQRFVEDDHNGNLFEIANIIRSTRARQAVPALIQALDDPNVDRRQAAAYALGLPYAGNRAIDALCRVLTDTSQPAAVRGFAAESLHGSRRAIPSLLSVLSDKAVEVRFWAVWSLGGQRIDDETTSQIVPALDKMLADPSVCEGWWSVQREALVMLGTMNLPKPEYRQKLDDELEHVKNDPEASPQDRKWADFWS